tara:strand:+ start:213 stop:359 length:147 start_codon:yes stop_codon:yes gene_type:complete
MLELKNTNMTKERQFPYRNQREFYENVKKTKHYVPICAYDLTRKLNKQ